MEPPSQTPNSVCRMSSYRPVRWIVLGLPILGSTFLLGQDLSDDGYAMAQGRALVAGGRVYPSVLQNDVGLPDPLPGEVWVTRDPEHGDLTFNSDGTFTYQPHPNFIGTVLFSYGVEVGEPVQVLNVQSNWRAFNPLDGRPPGLDTPGFDEEWNTLEFDVPQSWLRAQGGSIGYGLLGNLAPDTNLGLPEPERRYTAYLRAMFPVAESGIYRLEARIRRDDGVIAYLDGEELFRSFEPGVHVALTAPDGYFLMVEGTAEAWTGEGQEETAEHVVNVDQVELSAGNHCLAISLHNNLNSTTPRSSDLGFQLDSLQLVRMEEAVVAIEVGPGSTRVAGEPDWFVADPTTIFDTSTLHHNLYSNDGLFDENGAAYREILDLVVDDSQAEGTVLDVDPQTGDFRFQPTPDFTGVTSLSYQVTTEAGVSNPIKFYIWVASNLPRSSPVSITAGLPATENFSLPIPSTFPVTVVEQPASGTITLLPVGDSWQATYSDAPDKVAVPLIGSDRFVVEFAPTLDPSTTVRLPIRFKIQSPMAAWRARTFARAQLDPAISGALSDPDRDHYVNLLEYIFDRDPLDPDSAPRVPFSVGVTDSAVLVRAVDLPRLPPDVMVELQRSASGEDGAWVTIGANYGGLSANWLTSEGLQIESTLARDSEAAIYRYRFSLYPWVTDVPAGTP